MVILKKRPCLRLLFIGFHVLKASSSALLTAVTIAASFPDLAGGHLLNIIALGIIVSVCLVPFFAFREVSRELGEGRLWRLLMARRERSD